MKVTFKMRGLSPVKRRMLDADLKHTQLILLNEFDETLQKMRSNRGMQARIVNLLGKVSTFHGLTVEAFTLRLQSMMGSDVELLKYGIADSVVNGTSITTLEIAVDDTYFQLFESIPVMGKFLNYMSGGKKTFISKLEKSIRDDYTRDYLRIEGSDEVVTMTTSTLERR